jgi:hypothetical protein
MEYTVREEPKAKWACFLKDNVEYEVNIIDVPDNEVQETLLNAIELFNEEE